MGTAEKILDVAERLAQTHGLGGVSFRDLAAAIGVKSASVHYHFPTKDDLARAIAIRYRQRFERLREEIDRHEPTATGRLRKLFSLLAQTYAGREKICLAAALTSEREGLAPAVQEELARFFEENERWIAGVLSLGVEQKRMRLVSTPECTARVIFAAIEGSILAARACQDAGRITATGDCVLNSLES